MITLRNSFHHTEVRIRASYGVDLTPSQIRRSRLVLCGISGCTCGGILGERGPQDVEVDAVALGHIQLLPKDRG